MKTPCQEAPEAWVSEDANLRAAAARECEHCPVLEQCKAGKFSTEKFGVIAGTDYGVKITPTVHLNSPLPPSQEVKECEVCKTTIKRGSRSRGDWTKLRFCSRKCYGTTMAIKGLPEFKNCELCGGRYTRGDLSARNWLEVRFCGVTCAGKARRKVRAA